MLKVRLRKNKNLIFESRIKDEEYHRLGLVENIDLSSFKMKDELNQEIWHNNRLSSPISMKLKKIAFDFIDSLDIPRNIIKDITFTGSLANFNWSKFSDVDLHILIDFRDIDDNVDMVKEYLDSKRIECNKTHNIKIKDHEVEIYVQQFDEPHHSTGIYSILSDEWENEPSPQKPEVNEEEVKRKASYIMQEIDEVQKLYKDKKYLQAHDYASKLKERIRSFRKCGLEEGGELSTENIAFKALRRNGYLDKLSNIKTLSYDKSMSIEENGGSGEGHGTGGLGGGWVADDPSGWSSLRDNLIDEYPGSEVSAVYDKKKNVLKIYKISLPKELRGQGHGSEIMDKIVDWADDLQTMIVLSPSTHFGATSVNRLRKFYKRFGFVDNKGRKKDFTISDTMYRTPQ